MSRGELFQTIFVFSERFIWGKSRWFGALFQYISMAQNLAYNIDKLYKTLDYWSKNMRNFYFLEKGVGIVSVLHFVYDFSRKIFLMLYSKWRNFIDWLSLLLEILGNMCIAVVCFPGCDVINFEINFIFLIKRFFSTWPKSQVKKLNILRTKRACKLT